MDRLSMIREVYKDIDIKSNNVVFLLSIVDTLTEEIEKYKKRIQGAKNKIKGVTNGLDKCKG